METQQFILNTLLPYKNNKELRAFNDELTRCCYLTKDGKKCTIGQYLKDGEWQQFRGSVFGLNKKYGLENILKEQALKQNLDLKTWELIQDYHDWLFVLHKFYGNTTPTNDKRLKYSTNTTVKNLEDYLYIELKELYIN